MIDSSRIESWFTNVVSDFLCERKNRLNLPLKIERIQGFGPSPGTGFSVWHQLSILFHKSVLRFQFCVVV